LILKVSLVSALFGVLILLFLCDSYVSDSTAFENMNENIGKNVRVTGLVSSIREYPTVKIIKIKNGDRGIDIIAFTSENISIKENDIIDAEGEVVEYNNQTEIYADLLRIYH